MKMNESVYCSSIPSVQAVYCSFPGHRTQPVTEHALKKDKDLTGR